MIAVHACVHCLATTVIMYPKDQRTKINEDSNIKATASVVKADRHGQCARMYIMKIHKRTQGQTRIAGFNSSAIRKTNPIASMQHKPTMENCINEYKGKLQQ